MTSQPITSMQSKSTIYITCDYILKQTGNLAFVIHCDEQPHWEGNDFWFELSGGSKNGGFEKSGSLYKCIEFLTNKITITDLEINNF